MISVSARIMRRNALVALRIFGDGVLRVDEPDELGLDPLEALIERRIHRLGPRRVFLEHLLERLDSLGRQRVGPGITVGRVDREAVFLVLELAEELDDPFSRYPRLGQIGSPGLVRAGFLSPRKGEELAERGLLA